MKRIFLLLVGIAIFATSFSQQISKITLANTGSLEFISIAVDDNVIVNISDDGNISKFGLEPYNIRTENYGDYTDRLDKYMGRVEYYSANDNESFRGKVKYIGKTLITYFASYEDESVRGKIKSIGASAFDYYLSFEDKAFKGKIKNIGSVSISYFSSFENEGYRGKLRSVGPSNFSYYGSFDDKAIAGKIKSIGNVNFSYYTSFDRVEWRGRRKDGGNPIQYINGIKYYLKY